MKAYFSSYLFTSFFDRLDAEGIAAQCKLWGQFLRARGIRFVPDYLDVIERETRDRTPVAQCQKRLVLTIQDSRLSTQGQTRFEFQFFSALLPTCQCGFVHGDVNLEHDVIMTVLERGLADVMILPALSSSNEIAQMGSAWALYLDLKINAALGRKRWQHTRRGAASEVARGMIKSLKNEIGQEVRRFSYPSDVEVLNEWLGKCDSQLGSNTMDALAELLSGTKISIKEWQQLRWC
jgi:hypothetical protein